MSSGIRFDFRLQRQGFQLDARADLPAVGVSALFGASGCGKTTVLRCIAGLEPAVAGQLSVNAETWLDTSQGLAVSTHQRGIGYVFQQTALFPHINVQENLIYGWRRTPPRKRRSDPSKVTDMLGLQPLLTRHTDDLSGGERQRVAIGRALLNNPSLLLMDEPLAALDRSRKREILPYLERLHAEAEIPILYVTHDLQELVSVADHLALMENGRIIQSGPIEAMMVNTHLSIAMEEDAGALITAQVERHDQQYHLTELWFPGGRILVTKLQRNLGEQVKLRIHAKDVSLTLKPPGATSILNILPATITELTPQGSSRVIVRLEVAGVPILSRVTRRSEARLGLKPGMQVYAQIKSVALQA